MKKGVRDLVAAFQRDLNALLEQYSGDEDDSVGPGPDSTAIDSLREFTRRYRQRGATASKNVAIYDAVVANCLDNVVALLEKDRQPVWNAIKAANLLVNDIDRYYNALIAYGVDQLEDVAMLNADDWDSIELSIVKPLHRKKIARAALDLKLQLSK